jgi:hypothetical protein
MVYTPITDDKKNDWIVWLETQKDILNGKPEDKYTSSIHETDTGDVAAAKDLVGNLLALLTNKPVEIA